MKLVINTDGGGQAGDNVGGDAAAAYVVQTADGVYLGSRSIRLLGTNNDAEYNGVLLALNDLRSGEIVPIEDIESVTFIADSQLIVYHITGRWKCKHERLKMHRDKIRAIVKEFAFPIEFTWKRREFNMNADCLCTHAMAYGPKLIFTDPIPKRPAKVQAQKVATNDWFGE